MKPIAVFYHTLFYLDEVRPAAVAITEEAMRHLRESGLLEHCTYLTVGINGTPGESGELAKVYLPEKSRIIWHGLESRAENLTIIEIEKFVKQNPDCHVLYFHCKGATHTLVSDYGQFSGRWRRCMLNNLVSSWSKCVEYLDGGYEVVCCHWMQGLCDGTQNIAAGNFWWADSNYLRTLPSMYERERIKQSGIADKESRFEAEVWIGNGARLPKVKDVAGHGVGMCP